MDEHIEGQAEGAVGVKQARRKKTRRTDGEAGRATPVPEPEVFHKAQPEPVNTPGAPNAALKEPEPKAEDGVRADHPNAAHVQIVDRQKAFVRTTRKKFAICGFASSSRELIPVGDPEWEIWGMNQLYRHVGRADRWFDLHWNWDQELVPGTDHKGWIAASGIPVYMIEAHRDMPTTVRFPLEVLVEHFGADYFTSSVAHMMALAIWEIDRMVDARSRVEPMLESETLLAFTRRLYGDYTIGLFGIDLIVGEEYFWQKACAEFWVGAAAVGRGINVYTPKTSALCKQLFRYGYETEPQSVIKPAEMAAHKGKLTAERDELLKRLYMLDGAIQVDEYFAELIDLRLRGGAIKL